MADSPLYKILQQYILQKSSLFFAVLDSHGSVLACNEAMLSLTGPEKTLKGRFLKEFIWKKDQDRFAMLFTRPEQKMTLGFLDSAGNLSWRKCQMIQQEDRYLFFGEQEPTPSTEIIEEMSRLNNELSSATRILNKKNRQMQRQQQDLQRAREAAEEANREKDKILQHLEELVASRTAELEKARVKAESASQAKTNFLANMSHELRTPMNAIMGFAHLVQQEKLTPRQKDQMTRLSRSSRQLLRLINDLIDISRLEQDTLTLEEKVFQPEPLIRETIETCTSGLKKGRVELRVRLEDLPAWLKGDSDRLQQVLGHLLSNAVKFTEQGFIAFSSRNIAKGTRRITIRFEVQDTGIGLSRNQQENLFKNFEQADGSTVRRFGGTGTGLALSSKLVSLMQGRIGVDSVPGQGSTFWVELPFSPASGETSEQTLSSSPAGGSAEMNAESAAPAESPPEGGDDPPASRAAHDPEEVKNTLDHLESLLAESNTSANDYFERNRDTLTGCLGGKAGEIRQFIDDFEYAEALELLQTVRK